MHPKTKHSRHVRLLGPAPRDEDLSDIGTVTQRESAVKYSIQTVSRLDRAVRLNHPPLVILERKPTCLLNQVVWPFMAMDHVDTRHEPLQHPTRVAVENRT